ncbi:MAG TPA: DNA-binding protein [Polyangiaceae bacterium]|nr:DNA-binding protein [Polyangiaceae bacterium]
MIVDTIATGSKLNWLATCWGALLLVASAPRAAAAPSCDELSISAARALPLGSQVTIEGTVSTPSGVFASSFFDAGFGIQDRRAGIYVSVAANPEVVPGDRLRVTGVLADSYGLLVLIPNGATDIQEVGAGHPPAADRVDTGSIGESTEGVLVAVKGRVTQAPVSDLPYGYKFEVDDGSGELQIFVNVDTGIDLSSIAVGRKIKVTGLSSQFEDHYEIDPRFPQDVVLLPRNDGP